MFRVRSTYLVALGLMTALLVVPLAAQQEEMVEKAKDMAVDKAKDMVMDKAEEMAGEKKEMAAGGAPEMSPEEAAMMGAWQEAMTPGDPHAGLAEMVGTWTATIKSWMDPAAEPMVSEGTVERSMILGGRVLQEKLTSSFQGMPFEGVGMNGYDNVTGKYWSTWMDNMSTGLYVMHGSMDDAGVSTFYGEYEDPMTGGKKMVRAVTRMESDGKQIFEWHERQGEAAEVQTMEIVYVRQAM